MCRFYVKEVCQETFAFIKGYRNVIPRCDTSVVGCRLYLRCAVVMNHWRKHHWKYSYPISWHNVGTHFHKHIKPIYISLLVFKKYKKAPFVTISLFSLILTNDDNTHDTINSKGLFSLRLIGSVMFGATFNLSSCVELP